MAVQKETISDRLETLTELIAELDDFMYEHRIPCVDLKTPHGRIIFENNDIKNETNNDREL